MMPAIYKDIKRAAIKAALYVAIFYWILTTLNERPERSRSSRPFSPHSSENWPIAIGSLRL
jgi:hypothetical protein